jgi:hypothetical protein
MTKKLCVVRGKVLYLSDDEVNRALAEEFAVAAGKDIETSDSFRRLGDDHDASEIKIDLDHACLGETEELIAFGRLQQQEGTAVVFHSFKANNHMVDDDDPIRPFPGLAVVRTIEDAFRDVPPVRLLDVPEAA